MSSDYLSRLASIKALVFDVDGVLSSNCMVLYPGHQPLRTANVKDGYAMQLAVRKGLILSIITGGKAEEVRARYRALGLTDIYLGAQVKMDAFRDLLAIYALSPQEVLYMGDDIPDYEVMRVVSIAACPSDAAPEIKQIAHYISPYSGGQGCARDVIEKVLKAQGLWLSSDEAFGW